MRNISGKRSNPADRDGTAATPDTAVEQRGALKRELLEEMTSWSSGDRGVFKSWHRHALSLVHLQVLTLVDSDGPVSMRQLAESLDVSDAGATGVVDRMEKRGLVERRRDAVDRRVVFVHLTDAGRHVFEELAARRRERLSKLLDELSEGDMAALLRGVRAVHAVRNRFIESEAWQSNPGPPHSTG